MWSCGTKSHVWQIDYQFIFFFHFQIFIYFYSSLPWLIACMLVSVTGSLTRIYLYYVLYLRLEFKHINSKVTTPSMCCLWLMALFNAHGSKIACINMFLENQLVTPRNKTWQIMIWTSRQHKPSNDVNLPVHNQLSPLAELFWIMKWRCVMCIIYQKIIWMLVAVSAVLLAQKINTHLHK